MGSPYQLGGNGPAYDCSGITYAAWRSQGVTLPRSSRTQYAAVAHVPLSQMRPGDLVFYGTNRSPSAIYHVAMYIGNGMVAEATAPGEPVPGAAVRRVVAHRQPHPVRGTPVASLRRGR